MPYSNKKASTAIRGARTMGPGRPGVDMSAVEALMMQGEPNPGSAMPNTMPADMAQRLLAAQRMEAMLRAIQDSNKIPSPETR
jgi:hypothetical protein